MGSPEITEENAESRLIHGSDYTIPAPGSGTAGGDYCSTLEPIVTEAMLTNFLSDTLDFSQTDIDNLGAFYNAFSWPCHWNKLHEGESITIPLYTENADGSVNHPFEIAGVNNFTLKIRAACDPEQEVDREDEHTNEICNDNKRYDLVGDNPGEGVDTVIVLWEITGKQGDENGETVYLTHYKSSDIFTPSTTLDVETINLQTPLTEDSTAVKPTDDDRGSIESFLSTLYKPELKLLVVHTLNDTTGVVPYLEYQFSSTYNPSSTPVSNTSKVVHVEVMVDGGYSTVIDKVVDIAKSVSGFVIQQ